MRELCTIGYTKKGLREFIRRLKSARVDCLVDIRLNNTSQLAGYAKRDDLDFLLTEGFGISYEYMPELAPSQDLLDAYRQDKDWNSYTVRYGELVEQMDMVGRFLSRAEEDGWAVPCLLCAEDKSDQCHRRLLAEAIAARLPGLNVRHL